MRFLMAATDGARLPILCRLGRLFCFWGACAPERVWAISTARLYTLPCLHLRPIDVIVFDGPCVEILS